MLWRLNSLVKLSWRHWQNEWVVFDAGSGHTHQMDALTAATLMTVEAGELEMSELVTQVSQTVSIELNPELALTVQEILGRLVAVGLVTSTCE
ncbi:MAG: hypothetical protein BWK72_11140 [Rhodoferax ferrireducens]|uniref:HPr-rel-A system PqqD family protein n=1 Tax=Rhodoferax ferrireducens TaxID=192843 RepID=A0A1W9KUU3_9BURK|nr:MAG: hypothetical protein BWK72_11140 [Rhodoferax ferrireducens]